VRDPASHKGTHGTLVCVCGSLEYAGAALLCVSAAARGGAGLVALAVPRSLQPVVAGRVPEVVTLGLPEAGEPADIDARGATEVIAGRSPDALVIGPGLRESEGNRHLVIRLLAGRGGPVVVDGSGLNLLSKSGDWWTGVFPRCVLTPHPGEFERLMREAAGQSDKQRRVACRRAADRFHQVVVLKGAGTVIAEPGGRLAVAPFANAALATAGSGDVLAGLIGSFLAQGVEPFAAACLGVFIHGRAAERLSERLGDAGLLASDLAAELPLVRRELSQLLST
jgi:NAD(P)H-hydrate epimerase